MHSTLVSSMEQSFEQETALKKGTHKITDLYVIEKEHLNTHIKVVFNLKVKCRHFYVEDFSLQKRMACMSFMNIPR